MTTAQAQIKGRKPQPKLPRRTWGLRSTIGLSCLLAYSTWRSCLRSLAECCPAWSVGGKVQTCSKEKKNGECKKKADVEKESETRMASTKEEEEVFSKVEEEEKEKDEAFQAKGKSKGKGNVLAGVYHYWVKLRFEPG